jgi:hypothetical protein
MAENLNQIMWGEGVAFIGGKEAFEVQELSINFGLSILTAQKGDAGGAISIPTGQPITGRANFLSMNAALLATLTGGSSATGTKKRIRGENLTVASNAVTASETPITNTMRIIEQGANNVPLKQVAGAPAAADEYSVSGTTITFNTGTFANGIIIEASYFYTDGADGETVTIEPTDLPDSFELYGSIRTKDKFAGTKGDIVIYAAKCERTSEIAINSGVGNIATPGFDFNIEVDNSGDLLIYFP